MYDGIDEQLDRMEKNSKKLITLLTKLNKKMQHEVNLLKQRSRQDYITMQAKKLWNKKPSNNKKMKKIMKEVRLTKDRSKLLTSDEYIPRP